MQLVHVDHAVDERPEQRVCAEATEEAIRQQGFPGNKIFLPTWARFDDQQTEEAEQRHEVENESQQSSQPEDASRATSERLNGRKNIKIVNWKI